MKLFFDFGFALVFFFFVVLSKILLMLLAHSFIQASSKIICLCRINENAIEAMLTACVCSILVHLLASGVLPSAFFVGVHRSLATLQEPAAAMRLLELPEEILALVCTESLQRGASPSSLLTINTHWHKACSNVLYSCLAIPDSSRLLQCAAIDGVVEQCSTATPNRLVGKLRAIHRNPHYAATVKALCIFPNDMHHALSSTAETHKTKDEQDEVATTMSSLGRDALNDDQLLDFITSHLANIRSLTWLLRRHPSSDFVKGLHEGSSYLLSLDIIPSATYLLHRPEHSGSKGPTSPIAPPSAPSAMTALRWDACSLGFFELGNLVNLTLQNLSLDGVRVLGNICASLVSCQVLSLLDTLFVDDVLLSTVAKSMPRLRALCIKRMAGTKVTNKGLASLMESCHTLEELDLTELEGNT